MMRDLKPGELVAVMDYGNVWRVVEKRPGDHVRARCLDALERGEGRPAGCPRRRWRRVLRSVDV